MLVEFVVLGSSVLAVLGLLELVLMVVMVLVLVLVFVSVLVFVLVFEGGLFWWWS